MKLSVRKSYAVLYCPGCESPHTLIVKGAGAWQWNGNIERPTLHPSLLSNGDRFNPQMPRCHSFVTDGRIQFLSDSDHKLAGQTVDLPDVPECYQLSPETGIALAETQSKDGA